MAGDSRCRGLDGRWSLLGGEDTWCGMGVVGGGWLVRNLLMRLRLLVSIAQWSGWPWDLNVFQNVLQLLWWGVSRRDGEG